jgi:hypothetical protein
LHYSVKPLDLTLGQNVLPNLVLPSLAKEKELANSSHLHLDGTLMKIKI